MTASADNIARLRRMVAEPATTIYSDAALAAVIERYPVPDQNHRMPTSMVSDSAYAWVPTYDLNAAAAEIWQEKAAALVGNTDFSADGGNYSDSQKVDQAERQVRFYLSRRNAHTIRLIKWPPEKRIHEPKCS